MSSILHFNNVLINPRPLLHGYSAHVSGRTGWIILVVHCGSVSSYRQVLVLGSWSRYLYRETLEKFSPHSLWLYHTVHSRSWYSFSAQVPSPQTLAIQTCRRSCGLLLWFKNSLAVAFKRRENERTSFPSHAEFHRSWVPSLFGSPCTEKQVSAV